MVIYEATNNGVRGTGETINDDGTRIPFEYVAKYDGTDYPVKGWNGAFDTISLKRVNARTAQATLKKSGATVLIALRCLSQDGKTLTITGAGTNPKGRTFKNVAVYYKQLIARYPMNAHRRRSIEKLFRSAGQREPVERNAFLVEACRGDEELPREVEALLARPEASLYLRPSECGVEILPVGARSCIASLFLPRNSAAWSSIAFSSRCQRRTAASPSSRRLVQPACR